MSEKSLRKGTMKDRDLKKNADARKDDLFQVRMPWQIDIRVKVSNKERRGTHEADTLPKGG